MGRNSSKAEDTKGNPLSVSVARDRLTRRGVDRPIMIIGLSARRSPLKKPSAVPAITAHPRGASPASSLLRSTKFHDLALEYFGFGFQLGYLSRDGFRHAHSGFV
jgi:hypothetical protein